MNKKHLACLVLILLIAGLAQLTLWMNKRMVTMQTGANAAKAKVQTASLQLQIEKAQLAELDKNSRPLIEYLKAWQPYFRAVDSAQNAELKISLRIKESNLVSLSQRYEAAANSGNSFLSSVMRSQLTFEDDYAKLLNWWGQVEAQLPTLRTSSVRMSRGSGGNDLRMELVLEQPLLKK